MDLQDDPVAILSSACRLPLGITAPSQLWQAFSGNTNSKDVFSSLSSVPRSRHRDPKAFIDPSRVGGAGWLGTEGVEFFDPAFFNISPAEAETLRPNTRLALELTWEALERAGIPPASVRGKNVAVSIGVGTEDGWDLRRFSDARSDAFDHRWAANSDPSGVSGQVSHFYGFHGPCSVISTACSSGAFALRNAIQALVSEDCELAIVGAITTHFFTAPFDWAASVNVASKKGQCAAFSKEADGYVPSEGAVFFVLTRASLAQTHGRPAIGIIRSVATGHNGATRALAIPSVSAQIALTNRSLCAAGVSPSDVTILEAHGTGTRLGDAIEAEAFRTIYDKDSTRHDPLWVSSSKTLFGHCQAASTLVGILKVLACFEHRIVPPHLVDPLPEFKVGKILVPTSPNSLGTQCPIIAQVSSFGFTGSIASVILEAPAVSQDSNSNLCADQPYILPFSAKTVSALNRQITEVFNWACGNSCSLYDLGAILSLARDHHSVRLAIIATGVQDLRGVSFENYTPEIKILSTPEPAHTALLNLDEMLAFPSDQDRKMINDLTSSGQTLRAACYLYNMGHNLHFEEIYDLRKIAQLGHYLRSFPTYAFDRKRCWRDAPIAPRIAESVLLSRDDAQHETSTCNVASQSLSVDFITETVASILHIPAENVRYESDIFDLGVDSLNSIELANTLSQAAGIVLPALDLYSLLTVKEIHNYFTERGRGKVSTSQSRLSQTDVDAWVLKYGTKLDTPSSATAKRGRDVDSLSILLTGASGMLGCHVLHNLLSRSEVKQVFCPVRGDAWDRLLRSYSSHGHDVAQLVKERDSGRLVSFHVKDLADDRLGCEAEMYHHLVRNVDTIVHLAWKLDFNLPALAFENCVQGTRNLAQLSVIAEKHVDYYFISSFSAYFGYLDDFIPEQPLTADIAMCLDQGYAVSKLISEHALISMQRNTDSFNLRLVRVGQICGDSVKGNWSLNEMIPMMIKSLPVLKMLPRNLPNVSWIPSDICAAAISDFAVTSTAESRLQVLHVANPRVTEWPVAADMIARLAGVVNGVPLVSLREYVDTITGAKARVDIAIARLLPYFSGVVERGDLPEKYASLKVNASLTLSRALSTCPEVDENFLRPIVQFLLGDSPNPSGSTLPRRSLKSPILLFGPWSEAVSSSLTISADVKDQVQAVASRIRKEIQYDDEDQSLDYQLATLVSQISAYEELKNRGVVAQAVLGYCFGEYAASVCAGILSLETIIGVIARRAAALRNVKGSMLNVFADLSVVRRQLLKLPFDMEIAIYAGPSHYVLSGPPEHVSVAQSAFQKAGIKNKLVETSIPFHSSVMDNVVTSIKLPDIACGPGSSTYISGLTGNSISGAKLGPKYWLRHMRDPVMFVDAVRYIQQYFPASPLVDVGPGCMLTSVISRYKWDGCQIFTVNKFLDEASLPATLPVATTTFQRVAEPSNNTSVAKSTTETTRRILLSDEAIGADGSDVQTIITNILVSEFGFKGADPRALLSKSFLMLGLQSIDFVSFSEKVHSATGLTLPASSFASDASLSEIFVSMTSG